MQPDSDTSSPTATTATANDEKPSRPISRAFFTVCRPPLRHPLETHDTDAVGYAEPMTEILVETIHVIVLVLEALGVAAMVIGFAIAAFFSARALAKGRGGRAAFQVLRNMIGSSILLGLEILVAGDLIRTLLSPTPEEATVLGIIVIIRTILSISIQIEIEGVLPWKRALFTSGGQLMAEAVSRETRPTDELR